MCEHCCSVARKMGSCKQCKHATYCSAACQTAAWKAHKPACASLADPQLTTELGGDRDGRGTLLHAPLFLRETLRVRLPRVCALASRPPAPVKTLCTRVCSPIARASASSG